jgi:hypothetical protein
MNTIEERIRAAARAAADTVPPDSVPPLELPDELPVRFRWRPARACGPARSGWLTPTAAAAAIVTLAVVTVVISRGGPGGSPHASGAESAASPAPGPSISSYVASGQVPRYFVTTVPRGALNLSPNYAVVRATATGQTLDTISAAGAGDTIAAVAAAADDRTFVLDEQQLDGAQPGSDPFQPRFFVLLRLTATGQVQSLFRVPVTVPNGQLLTGFALSPDGRELVTAVQPDDKKSEPDLTVVRLYALPAGTVTRTWIANGTIGSSGDDPRALSWTADGRTLAFNWLGHGMGPAQGVWLLDLARHGGGLLADSRQVMSWEAASGITPHPVSPASISPLPTVAPPAASVSAEAAAARPTCQDDSIITPDGSAVVCAAVADFGTWEQRTRTGMSLRRGAVTAFIEYATATGRPVRTLGRWRFGNAGALGIDVLWSSPSGDLLIGVIPNAGDGEAGVISGDEFTPLPGQGSSTVDQAGTW